MTNATPIQTAPAASNLGGASRSARANKAERSMTKPNAMSAMLVLFHASSVRSAANRTLGSFSSDIDVRRLPRDSEIGMNARSPERLRKRRAAFRERRIRGVQYLAHNDEAVNHSFVTLIRHRHTGGGEPIRVSFAFID